MIIIPDVHGRTFWKDAVKQRRNNEKVIFLGDYLDPYAWENISKEDAISNFKEIVKYARYNEDTILLLGNHDFMVYLSNYMGNCRSDIDNKDIIRKIFSDNFYLFKVAHTEKIDNTSYIFSHAPILKMWVDDNKMKPIRGEALFCDSDNNAESIVNKLNDALRNRFMDLERALNCVGFSRGGCRDVGSCVWADVTEVGQFTCLWNAFSIFGHTQLRDEPIITEYWACLDCRRAFRLTDDEEIIPITDKILIET